jgi:hypothetical protein
MAKLNFDIHKCAGPARTSVWVLLHKGEYAGRIITAWPADGAGRVRLYVAFFSGEFGHSEAMFGQAGGYGYDKESAAFADAIKRHGIESPDISGRGMQAVAAWLGSKGYTVIHAL